MYFENNIENIIRNYKIYYIIYLLFINSIFFISFIIFNYYRNNNFSPYSPQIIRIKIDNGNSAKIGIISDFQLDINTKNISNYKLFENNVINALTVFKKNNIDIIIIPGDITNRGRSEDYLLFKKLFYLVYDNYNQNPKVISLMGNHDYIDLKFDINKSRQRFYNFMKSYPYSHYIINNYNFIFWSNDNSQINNSGIQDYSWIKDTLEIARKNKNKKGDPIFVITHMHPKKTCYGSENIWGHTGITNILKNYPEVICISGHSHYSLRNIKSIYQGNFTVINTQSLSYVDLDKIYANAMAVRIESAKNDAMGLIAYLNQNNIIFDRIEFSTEEIMEERWKIDFPMDVSNFIYSFDKRNKKIKPIFKDNNEIKIEKIKKNNNIIKNNIVFNAAFHEDYVYKYKVIFKNSNYTKQFFYYSDYYKNKKFRKEILKFEIPKTLNKGKYNVEIYAFDSFDNISKPKIGLIDL